MSLIYLGTLDILIEPEYPGFFYQKKVSSNEGSMA